MTEDEIQSFELKLEIDGDEFVRIVCDRSTNCEVAITEQSIAVALVEMRSYVQNYFLKKKEQRKDSE